ncbi:MAG: hypothetical protein M3333_09450 [Actinomycetota bacterium]|nr:hypothetical protein [Actinomycetota bacterium]
MIKMRAGIQEEEDAEAAAEKLSDVIALHVEDEGERRWLEPRVGHLLGLEQRSSLTEAAQEALAIRRTYGFHHETVKVAYIETLEDALAVSDSSMIEHLLAMVEGAKNRWTVQRADL